MTESIRAVTTDDLPQEDIAALTECLQRWRDAGVAEPLIPHSVDVDGDGQADAFSLDASGQLVFVRGVALADTVYQATGTKGGTDV